MTCPRCKRELYGNPVCKTCSDTREFDTTFNGRTHIEEFGGLVYNNGTGMLEFRERGVPGVDWQKRRAYRE